MGFGAFDVLNRLKGGSGGNSSSDPNSTNYSGGSGNIFADEIANYSRANRSPIIRADDSGFMPYQRQGLNVFAQLLRGKSSGDWSARGFNLPTSEDAVVGSALTQAAPNLFALQNQNQLLPGQIVEQNINPLLNAGSFSRGPGLGFSDRQSANSQWWDMWNKIGSSWGGAGGAKGGGGGLQCWIARELYGHNDARVNLISDYLNAHQQEDSWLGRFATWYGVHGVSVADAIASQILAPESWQAMFAELTALATRDRQVSVVLSPTAYLIE